MTKLFSWSVALIVAFAATASAQTFRGGISGRVIDSTGAVLPGVTLTATNTGTGILGPPHRLTPAISRFDLPLGPTAHACAPARPASVAVQRPSWALSLLRSAEQLARAGRFLR